MSFIMRRLLPVGVGLGVRLASRAPASLQRAQGVRSYATHKDVQKVADSGAADFTPMTFQEKVVEGGKDVGSVAVILAGIGLAGTFLYSVTSELFGSGSPNSVYDKAFDRIKTDEQVVDYLGTGIKAHGSGRRQRNVEHSEFEVNGIKHMRMQFYVEGSEGAGVVRLEVVKSPESGNYEYRSLVVDVPTPRGTGRLVLEDNRSTVDHYGEN